MKPTDFIYAPAIKDEFQCNVPLHNANKLHILNGSVHGTGSPLSINVHEGETMDKLLQVIGIRNGEGPDRLSFCSYFKFADNSSGKILLCNHTLASNPFVTDESIKIELGVNAVAEFTVMQKEHNRAEHNINCDISLAAGASLNIVFLSINGGKISNTVNLSFNGSHAECSLNGLYLTDGEQVMDYCIKVDHLVPECHSTQMFKGILADKGVSHFDGLIKVAQDAQKTTAFQANHNLLLSDQARANSKPQLEIYADDVKCSHGATVGRLNEEELFYMRTRGITAQEARILQQMAFAAEVIDKISTSELKERMTSFVEARLRGAS